MHRISPNPGLAVQPTDLRLRRFFQVEPCIAERLIWLLVGPI